VAKMKAARRLGSQEHLDSNGQATNSEPEVRGIHSSEPESEEPVNAATSPY
jgi:hypothetical protein